MRVINKISILLIRLYQRFISPIFPASCRFHPTCSQYSLEAFRQYSAPKAFWLSVKRITKCHPFHPGGFDPLPKTEEKIHG